MFAFWRAIAESEREEGVNALRARTQCRERVHLLQGAAPEDTGAVARSNKQLAACSAISRLDARLDRHS
jgi:hypothetical protein|eukprot:5939494-Prymnesium_polylepis.1